jgi:ribosomal protein S18 acetylase RimI-like enzyme
MARPRILSAADNALDLDGAPKQMWIDEAYRGRGYARELLNAFVAEAARRGVRRIWVASYDFQAPGMYEKAGFKRVAEFPGWPEGHSNVVLCKTFIAR